MTDEDDEVPHVCDVEEPVTAEQFSVWFVPGMLSNLCANVSRSGVTFFNGVAQFFEEMGHSLWAHGLWRQKKQQDDGVVDSFREQLTRL